MRNPKGLLVVLLFAGLPAGADEQPIVLREHVELQEHLHLIEQPKPEFPKSEFVRGREGWVLLSYDVLEDGTVFSPVVEASSGSEAFDDAAVEAVSRWRYIPGEIQTDRVLVHFVYERKQPYVSKKFFARDRKVHAAIDKGRLDNAQERIDEMRRSDDLTAVELAYTYIAEGRIHGVRGDREGQLQRFRRAMINDGRWLSRKDYLKLLHAAVILELQLGDYSSALRDYRLLTETNVGRKLAEDIEEPMTRIVTAVENGAELPPPYTPAELEVFIVREPPQPSRKDQFPRPEPEREPSRPQPQPRPDPPRQQSG
ncbi:MAG TPA: energy transducer TonB [Woeseiaceae bacterium]|nr:energy transducer TonB [Woeseiaceae bacterium]